MGMENNQDYRQTIKDICQPLGLEVIDPWNREKNLYKGTEKYWWKTYNTFDFVERDLNDAERCDIMIVYLPILSAGACMEMFYAKRKGKHIITITEMPRISPWIIAHSDKILKNFNQLADTLEQILKP
jgi:nucleoside 2-deoxyribosyltransferase